MTRQQSKISWWEALLKIWPAILIIGGGLTSYVLMNNEVKLLRQDYNVLKEQVNRQYGTQRDMNDKVHDEIEKINLKLSFQDGYEKALKEKISNP